MCGDATPDGRRPGQNLFEKGDPTRWCLFSTGAWVDYTPEAGWITRLWKSHKVGHDAYLSLSDRPVPDFQGVLGNGVYGRRVRGEGSRGGSDPPLRILQGTEKVVPKEALIRPIGPGTPW